jgi:hypothetical protein
MSIILSTSDGEVSLEEFLSKYKELDEQIDKDLEKNKKAMEKLTKARVKLEESKTKIFLVKTRILEKSKLLNE